MEPDSHTSGANDPEIDQPPRDSSPSRRSNAYRRMAPTRRLHCITPRVTARDPTPAVRTPVSASIVKAALRRKRNQHLLGEPQAKQGDALPHTSVATSVQGKAPPMTQPPTADEQLLFPDVNVLAVSGHTPPMTPPPTAAQQKASNAVGVVVPGARRHVLTPNAAVPAAQGTPTFGVKRQRSQFPPSQVEGGDFPAHAAVAMSLPGRAPPMNRPPTAAQQQPSAAVARRHVHTPNAAVPAAQGTPTFGVKRQRSQCPPSDMEDGDFPAHARAAAAQQQPSPAVARRRVLTPNAAVPAAHGTPTFGVKRQRSQFPPSHVEGGDFPAHATAATSMLGGAPPMTPPPPAAQQQPSPAVGLIASGTVSTSVPRRAPPVTPPAQAGQLQATAAQQQPSPAVGRRHVLTPNAAVPAAHGTPTFGVKRQRSQFPPSQVEGGNFAAHATVVTSMLGGAPAMTPRPTAAQQQPSPVVVAPGARRHVITPNSATRAAHGTPAFGVKRQRYEDTVRVDQATSVSTLEKTNARLDYMIAAESPSKNAIAQASMSARGQLVFQGEKLAVPPRAALAMVDVNKPRVNSGNQNVTVGREVHT